MNKSRCVKQFVVVASVAVSLFIGCSRSDQTPPTNPAPSPDAVNTPTVTADQAMQKGLDFLRAHQAADGAYRIGDANLPVDIGVTGLVLKAMASSPQASRENDPSIAKAVQFLLAHQEADGGIRGPMLGTYTTSIAIVALEALQNPKYKDNIDRAVAYVKTQQYSGATGPDSYKNGGFGYGSTMRPDLSNTQMAFDAFQAAGLAKDDPAYSEAIKFISRCQNNSETNDLPVAGTDGGAYYNPVESKAGDYLKPDGTKGWRSYGSMTYALVKSMIYANLPKEDPRIQAAVGWIKKNYTLDENPGMGKAGLYYYYHTVAKALSAYGEDVITDDKGVQHKWREELTAKLLSLQRPDGSLVNEKDRWGEDNPVLVTSYAFISLQEAAGK